MQYKIGNIVKATEDIIVQGCNMQGVMGSGVAKAIRSEWPEVFTEYRRRYETPHGLDLGEVIWYTTPKGKLIGNAISQKYYGRDGSKYVSYDAIDTIFQLINHYAKTNNVPAIAIPAIGAGLGGGDWNIIKTIIELRMTDATPVLYVLEKEASDFIKVAQSKLFDFNERSSVASKAVIDLAKKEGRI